MPNTPTVVGAGYTAYCPGQNVTEEDLSLIKSILEVTGVCQLLPEKMINAVGAISSSGPAFVFIVSWFRPSVLFSFFRCIYLLKPCLTEV
jgi:pyrroline-5-carboxylate reductase